METDIVKILDITRPLSDTSLVYPGDPVPSFTQKDHGDYRISVFSLGTHAGTHIDAPSHYLKGGLAIDAIPFGNLVGGCRVLDMRGAGNSILESHLEGKIKGTERLLLKTRFSSVDSFEEDYPCLDITAARYLIQQGIRCVGIDSPSIEAFHGNGDVHREILGSGCSIIEMLDLSGVAEGDYQMTALPLRLAGLDGSPARVLLQVKGE
jgi:arylformamidase